MSSNPSDIDPKCIEIRIVIKVLLLIIECFYFSVQVYTFFSLILVDVVVFTAASLLLLIGYSRHWSTREVVEVS